MIDTSDFGPQLTAQLAEAETEYAEVSAELPQAVAALEEAKQAAFRAQARYNHFLTKINRASRSHQDDLLGVLCGSLNDLELSERRLRDIANAALTRAEKDLGNLRWRHQNLAADVMQLRKAITPPPEIVQLPVVPRPARPEMGDVDDIVLPARRGAA